MCFGVNERINYETGRDPETVLRWLLRSMPRKACGQSWGKKLEIWEGDDFEGFYSILENLEKKLRRG